MTLASEAKIPAGYALVRGLIRFLLALFYRRVAVVGEQHVPETGGLVVAANHHNSIVDAMLLLAVLPRRLRTLANAPLFSHPFVGPFLRLLGALPVHRRQEAGNDPARNAALFAATTATLRGGGAIAIFPEGRTQPEPVLLELRTGAARMLLAAAAEQSPVSLLPVGMVFHEPGTFREGEALVLIGPPVPTAGAVALARTESERAGRELTDALATALRGLIVEADDRQTLHRLGLVEELWRAEGGALPADVAGRVAWRQRVVRTYRKLAEQQPARMATLEHRLDELAAETDRAGLRPDQLERHPTPARLALRAGLQFVLLLLGFPLALLGIVLHVVPYELTGFVDRKMDATDEEEATDKIAAGMVLFPLAWALEAWGAWRLLGLWALLALLVALFPAGFFALAWRARLDRMQSEARAFLHCLRDRDLPARLGAQQDALAEELRALARLVPEEWPE
jgi:1-acyl-sn-glycerol-3-phosphate acyltransferase